MMVPRHLQGAVLEMRRNFDWVTGYWLETAQATHEDVAHMRAVIAEQIGSEAPPTPEIDDRCRADRIAAWCETWRDLASRTPRPWRVASSNGVLLSDMVIEPKGNRQ